MIDVYYWPTPNGKKVTIFLEESGVEYRIVPVNIGKGDQFADSFLRLNPNHRMPVIVDYQPLGGGSEPTAVFESGAILFYLAEKTGKFHPLALAARKRAGRLPQLHISQSNIGKRFELIHYLLFKTTVFL